MHQAVNPPGWPRPKGYSNGILASGRFLAIAGQSGSGAAGAATPCRAPGRAGGRGTPIPFLKYPRDYSMVHRSMSLR